MIYYKLTKEEKEDGRELKTWDERTYLVSFNNNWIGGDCLEVDKNDLDVMEKVLRQNRREYRVEKNKILWW